MSTDTVHDLAPEPAATISTPERLRMLADWYEQHPTARAPDSISYMFAFEGETVEGSRIFDVVGDAAQLADRMRELGGQWDKVPGADSAYYFGVEQGIVPGVLYRICVERTKVCKRVVVGTETVMEPAPDAPMVEIERDVVEWRCPPSLMALSSPLQPAASSGERPDPETMEAPRA